MPGSIARRSKGGEDLLAWPLAFNSRPSLTTIVSIISPSLFHLTPACWLVNAQPTPQAAWKAS